MQLTIQSGKFLSVHIVIVVASSVNPIAVN